MRFEMPESTGFGLSFQNSKNKRQKTWTPAQMHTGETKEKDPGSRPESQRVASCANRLVVTPGAYREDADETLDPGSAPYREDGVRSIQG